VSLGRVSLEEQFNGHEQVRLAFVVLLRLLLKRLVAWRKFVMQYVLHVWVRFLFYVDQISSYLYAHSRNLFVKSAINNKSSVPHFWEHLKTYKQEIDKEKEEN
jgi:hypothetical protein